MKYKFDYQGMHFEGDLDDKDFLDSLLEEFDNDEVLQNIIDNKENYLVLSSEQETIKLLEEQLNITQEAVDFIIMNGGI